MQFQFNNNDPKQTKPPVVENDNNITQKLLDLKDQTVTPHDRSTRNDTSISEEIGREIQRSTSAVNENCEEN